MSRQRPTSVSSGIEARAEARAEAELSTFFNWARCVGGGEKLAVRRLVGRPFAAPFTFFDVHSG